MGNLWLNPQKTRELIIRRSRSKSLSLSTEGDNGGKDGGEREEEEGLDKSS